VSHGCRTISTSAQPMKKGTIAVNAEAGYHQLGEFFERVAKLARVVNVTEIKLSGLNRPRNPIRAELVLATYMYRPVGSAPAPKPK